MLAAPFLSALPADAQAKAVKKASAIQPGDLLGLVAPASIGSEGSRERAVQRLTDLGFRVREGKHLMDGYGYLAARDRDRAADINAMFADPEVKALVAIRGGWGAARMLRYLDWPTIAANPKLLIGYSDITALHLAIAARAGFPTIHGVNASSNWEGRPWESFQQLAIRGETPTFLPLPLDEEAPRDDYKRHDMIAPGTARGRLLGGNLTVFTTMIGSQWIPDFDGAILFVEDVDEAEYRIDRMMNQLAEAGILGRLNGFVFGQCSDCSNDEADEAGFSIIDILRQYIAPLNIPAFSGAHFGHISGQYCLPMGCEVEIDGEAGSIRVLESAVAR